MRKFILTLGVSIIFLSANACEICGCGLGNYYIGLLPHFNHRFFGIRYHFNSFRTRLTNDPTQFSNDFYQTVELWSGFNVGKRMQVLVFVPYNFNHQVSDEGTTNINGFGDAAMMLNYKLVDVIKNKVSQQFWMGAGIKLPTGKFTVDASDPDVAAIANTQRGSGSTDYFVNTMYNVRINNWGVNTSATYKVNTANKSDYKFGNKFSGSSFVYYAASAGKTTISPNVGLMYEHTKTSELNKANIDLTGGSLFQAAAGLEIGFKKMAVGFNAQLPVAQNFAGGQTKAKVKGMVHITFAL
jgi:hypothetical protein